jgi:hypothetical protein
MARPKSGAPKEALTMSAAATQPASAEPAHEAAACDPPQEPAEEEKLEVCCATPLDYMLGVMRDPAVEPARRDEMAKLALPYLHPKPTAIEHTGKDGGPIEISDVSKTDIARRIGFIFASFEQAEKH